jgi:hypothetical protein
MKHSILFFFLLLCTGIINAQGTLQFNRVVLVTTQQTVPAGKVWKVESVVVPISANNPSYASSGSASCGSSFFRNHTFRVNGVETKAGNGSMPIVNTGYEASYTPLPLWLPAGATLDGGPCNIQVSVIEFNILP